MRGEAEDRMGNCGREHLGEGVRPANDNDVAVVADQIGAHRDGPGVLPLDEAADRDLVQSRVVGLMWE